MAVDPHDQTLLAAAVVRVGDIIDGKYRVERIIGSGAMGVVLGATHLRLHENVAIKVLRPETVRSADVVGRFLREARAAVKIKSEHVVRVLDAGTLDSGPPFMVMESLDGYDLGEELRTRGRLPVVTAVDYVAQVCAALAEAHAAGIIHRDLKPANLFLTRRPDGSPCIKVLDFGISKVLDSGDQIHTRTTAVMGSPLYMAPEQMRSSRDVDERADIYSIGVILYELLAGAPPYNADSLAQLIQLVIGTWPRPLRAARPDVPAELEAAIMRCLGKRPEDRYPDVGSLAQALLPFASEWGRMTADRAVNTARSRPGFHPRPASQPPPGPGAYGAASQSPSGPVAYGAPSASAHGAPGAAAPMSAVPAAGAPSAASGSRLAPTLQSETSLVHATTAHTITAVPSSSGKMAVFAIVAVLAASAVAVAAYFLLVRGRADAPDSPASEIAGPVTASASSAPAVIASPEPTASAPPPASSVAETPSSAITSTASAAPAPTSPAAAPVGSGTRRPGPEATAKPASTSAATATTKPRTQAPGKGGDLEMPREQGGL